MEIRTADDASARVELRVRLAPGGDQEVLGQLFSRYARQLYRTAFRVLGSRDDAEDAVQDGLLSAVRNLGSFEGRSQFSTWLTRVVVNAALMRRRKLRGFMTTSIDQQSRDESGLSLASNIADSRPDPEQTYAREERFEMLKRTLEALPESYRSALWLRDIEGMTTQEAAAALRVTEGTLKSRLHRARLEVAKRIQGFPGAHIRRFSEAVAEGVAMQNLARCETQRR